MTNPARPVVIKTRSLVGDKSYYAWCLRCDLHPDDTWRGPDHWSGKNAVRDERRARALAAADRKAHREQVAQ